MRPAHQLGLFFASARSRVVLVAGAALENAPSRHALAVLAADELALEGHSIFLKLEKRKMENRQRLYLFRGK